MKNARIIQQGGWAGSFVVVGIILSILLVSGVYFFNKSTLQSENATTTPEVSRDDLTTTPPTADRDKNTDKEDASSSSDTDPKPIPPTASTDESAAAPKDETTVTSEDLPQTGPAETAARLLACGILAYSAAAYIRSRRATSL